MSQKNTMIPKRIAQIRFGLMEPKEIRQMSAVEVKTADTYKDDGHVSSRIDGPPHGCHSTGGWCALLTIVSTTNLLDTLDTLPELPSYSHWVCQPHQDGIEGNLLKVQQSFIARYSEYSPIQSRIE